MWDAAGGVPNPHNQLGQTESAPRQRMQEYRRPGGWGAQWGRVHHGLCPPATLDSDGQLAPRPRRRLQGQRDPAARGDLVLIVHSWDSTPAHFSLIMIKGSNLIRHESCRNEHENVKG